MSPFQRKAAMARRRTTRRTWPLAVVAMLLLLTVSPSARAVDHQVVQVYAEHFSFSAGAGRSSPLSVILWSTGAASAYVDTSDVVGNLHVRAIAQQCEGAPHLQVAVDGVTRLTREVDGEGGYVALLAAQFFGQSPS